MIETLDDVVEYLANQAVVYGAHRDDEKQTCRACWTADVKARILAAVEVEEKLGERFLATNALPRQNVPQPTNKLTNPGRPLGAAKYGWHKPSLGNHR